MRRFLRLVTLWLWGGAIYWCVEMAWRGHSHWTMFIVGGLCFLLLGGINNWLAWRLGLVWQALIGAAVVTAVELVAGVVLNLGLGMRIWDYSRMWGNLLGQICLPFAIAWIPLSVAGIVLDDYLRYVLYGEQKPKYALL